MSEPQFFNEGDRVAVLTTQPPDQLLDYKAPPGGVFRGAFVEVPLGPRRILGVVWGVGLGGFDARKLRSVVRVLDLPPMQPEMTGFIEKLAAYTVSPLQAVLRLATRSPGLMRPTLMQKVLSSGSAAPDRMTKARARVLDVLEAEPDAVFTPSELAELAGVSASVITGLIQQRVVLEQETPRDLPYAPVQARAMSDRTLSVGQARAAAQISAAIDAGGYKAWLLQGVTGSGKTEVYLEAIAQVIARGRQALVLLPEIALTAAFLERIRARFGVTPAQWHSGVTLTERRRCWRMVAQGDCRLVVGARSALFLPFQNLGLLVVDEEHDSSYKQEDGVFYNARDMAVLRGSLCSAQVILASATPSLESWANAQSAKYTRLVLPQRFGSATLPDISTIDMRRQKMAQGRWISPVLEDAVRGRIGRGEQAMLFLNRRGYAPLTLCRACGHQIACDHCDARMVEHRFQGRLVCHQCGSSEAIPTVCPSCGVADKLAPIGPGVERLAEEAAHLFPDVRLAILSSDQTASARTMKQRIEDIAQGSADLVIGTQIVAKGHNFPLLTLVGVIDADLGLHGSDLRAGERTFQLMRQVSGRAGRVKTRGVALLQTHQPEHPVLRAIVSGDEEGYWTAEAGEREVAGMPPYGRLAGIILSGPDARDVYGLGSDMARNVAPLVAAGAQVFGPAPAPIARIRGRHRVRLLVKAGKGVDLQAALQTWTRQFKLRNNMRMTIDIDPQSFL